ncbi:MAG: hypothetical protein K6F00_09255 [Lachnospiraceae bacterium]|nr:hypothetical protein [Lachnospiraceae bacterium]
MSWTDDKGREFELDDYGNVASITDEEEQFFDRFKKAHPNYTAEDIDEEIRKAEAGIACENRSIEWLARDERDVSRHMENIGFFKSYICMLEEVKEEMEAER